MLNQKTVYRKSASAVLLFGIIQWILVIMLAEGIQPNYISSIHYVSSLGTGMTASFYNLSTILLGICITAGSLLINKISTSRAFCIMLLISGLATVGVFPEDSRPMHGIVTPIAVGVFPEDSRPMHGIVTPIALIFGAISAMLSYKLQNKPASYFCIALGVVSLVTGLGFIPYLGLPVESRVTYFGFYKGTLERIVIYTNLLWLLILGSQLSNNQDNKKTIKIG